MANTHLGVPANDLILLESIGVKDTPNLQEQLAFFRIDPVNGAMDPSSGTFGYTAPKGKALVLTDVDWQFENGSAGGTVTLRIFLTWPGNPGIERRVLESTILLGKTSGGGLSTTETTGIVVPSKVKITVDVIGSGVGSGKLQHVLMRGYLIDFK